MGHTSSRGAVRSSFLGDPAEKFSCRKPQFRPRKKKGAKKKETPPGALPPDPQDLSLSCQNGSQKPGGQQKTKPDISFVTKTGHFHLSRTAKKGTCYDWTRRSYGAFGIT